MNLKPTSTEPKSEYITHQILVPLGINLLSTLLIVIITFLISRPFSFPWWLILLVVGISFLIFTAFNQRRITIRSLRLRIFKEISSSKCGEHFVVLASYYFHHAPIARKALTALLEITEVRRHPNSRLLQPIINILHEKPSLSDEIRRQILRYLDLTFPSKTLIREQVIQNVTRYLSDLTPTTYLVLYGYSSTICQSLVAVGEQLLCPVFLVQDLQYGVEGSLGEHKEVQKHLRRGAITPIILPFDQITMLCSENGNFVRTTSGKLVPLAKRRRVIALIGCEASDVGGTILIPSQLKGKPSETAKFVEVFQKPKLDGILLLWKA